MKNKKIIFFLFTLLMPVLIFAQRAPWTVIINAPAGYELYLENLWSVDIINQEETPVHVTLLGEVLEATRGEMFRGRSNPLVIPPGGRQINAWDIEQIKDKWFNPEFERALNRTGRFPAGHYTLCITVIELESNESMGRSCIEQTVSMPAAPRLITPPEDETVREPYPIFQWTEPTPVPPDAQIFYYFKVCEVYPGQTVQDAINNIAYYEIRNYEMTSIQYPMDAQAFEDGKEYVWQVQALDANGQAIGENDGKSEIWKFRFVSPERIGPTPELITPDTLVIGGFKLAVLKYTSLTDFKLSGKAIGNFLTSPCGSGSIGLGPGGLYTNMMSQTDFEVDFKNLEIKNWPPQKTEKVIKGKIEQVFAPPLHLQIDDFALNIQKLVLLPDSAAAQVTVELPSSAVSRYASCQPATIGPLWVNIDPLCRIFTRQEDFRADSLVIGNTGILCSLRGAEIDFKSSPRKVTFFRGRTIAQRVRRNNSGYLQASYRFAQSEVIACQGLKATLLLNNSWQFTSLIPLDFRVQLTSGTLEIEKSWVKSGSFAASVTLPSAVKNSAGDSLVVTLISARVDSLLNFTARVAFDRDQDICWGGYRVVADSAGFFLPGMYEAFALAPLDTSSTKKYKPLESTKITPLLKTMPGLTINFFRKTQRDSFFVLTPDTRKPLNFPLEKTQINGWLNIAYKGVTGELQSKEEMKLMDVRLGVPGRVGYKSDSTFTATIEHRPDSLFWVDFQFVRNATANSYMGGQLTIPYPCDFVANYKNLTTTSTAELVGGDVFFKEQELKYWGVRMTADTSGNVLSVDTGEIIYMNSGIKEKVHFAKPFRIIWGEMLADGNLGKFLFDYNSAGQQFDGFPFTLHAASLSKYIPTKPTANDTLGHLRAFGDVHFNFFGARLLDIRDYKDARSGHDKKPYLSRFVLLNKKNSKRHFKKNWGAGTARMDFDVDYDLADQNGFQGVTEKQPMVVDMQFLSSMKAGTINPQTIDLNSKTSFIHFCSGVKIGNDSQVLKLMKADFASINTISGIIQIQGDAIKRIVLEGQASIKSWKFEGHSLASLEITPNNIILRNRGQVSFTCYSVGLLGLASTKFVLNKTTASLEGDITGVFQIYGGSNFVVNQSLYTELEARGKFNFYISPDANYVQGYGKIKAKFGITLECEGAFFAGYKAPTDKIWALDEITRGPSIREIIKKQGKTKLTGIYIAGSFSYTVRLIEIIEGGYTIWAGIGFFGPTIIDKQPDLSTTFLGHAGLELHGEILEGLVSASAWAELLAATTLPLNPLDLKICMQGTLGLKACVLIFCASWQGTIHIDETGVGTGGCYGID